MTADTRKFPGWVVDFGPDGKCRAAFYSDVAARVPRVADMTPLERAELKFDAGVARIERERSKP